MGNSVNIDGSVNTERDVKILCNLDHVKDPVSKEI